MSTQYFLFIFLLHSAWEDDHFQKLEKPWVQSKQFFLNLVDSRHSDSLFLTKEKRYSIKMWRWYYVSVVEFWSPLTHGKCCTSHRTLQLTMPMCKRNKLCWIYRCHLENVWTFHKFVACVLNSANLFEPFRNQMWWKMSKRVDIYLPINWFVLWFRICLFFLQFSLIFDGSLHGVVVWVQEAVSFLTLTLTLPLSHSLSCTLFTILSIER